MLSQVDARYLAAHSLTQAAFREQSWATRPGRLLSKTTWRPARQREMANVSSLMYNPTCPCRLPSAISVQKNASCSKKDHTRLRAAIFWKGGIPENFGQNTLLSMCTFAVLVSAAATLHAILHSTAVQASESIHCAYQGAAAGCQKGFHELKNLLTVSALLPRRPPAGTSLRTGHQGLRP